MRVACALAIATLPAAPGACLAIEYTTDNSLEEPVKSHFPDRVTGPGRQAG